MTSKSAYYYNDGAQVPLQPAEELAVDLEAAFAAGLPQHMLATLRKSGRELRTGLVMLDPKDIRQEVANELRAAHALQPVFHAENGVLIVILPEVRFEASDKEQAAEIRKCLGSTQLDSEVVRDRGEFLVVRPTSGSGADALELANRIEEEVHPPMAQARFLRIVSKPKGRVSGS
jgi:hypothetical protein